ncbi:MAG: phosphate ABC transporter substrate-binding protein [Candidatus Omnitrophica bacterium]|nr:phosphate ABC transporter substrate-binding protein [Candidatus Omnitrophota bacterium]
MRIVRSVVFITALLISCNTVWAANNSIQIKGSDTMVNLGQAWAEAYMQNHKDALIAVTGGGSGTGIAALMSGTCDIAESSRSIKAEEIAQAKTKGIVPVEYKVGLDGLAVVVNPSNSVEKLTIDQLADIFTGKIKNWKEVGGKDGPIVLLSREVNSGTHVYFKEHVLRKGDAKSTIEFDSGALLMSSSQAIADEVAQNSSAIGYYGMGYISKAQKAIAVAKDAASQYYLPTLANVVSNKYYISRPLLFYTNGQPQGLVKDFVDFVFSAPGQEIVKDTDFVPVK